MSDEQTTVSAFRATVEEAIIREINDRRNAGMSADFRDGLRVARIILNSEAETIRAYREAADELRAAREAVREIGAQSRAELIDSILREVCELPDRTSPYYDSDILLVRESELRLILEGLLP